MISRPKWIDQGKGKDPTTAPVSGRVVCLKKRSNIKSLTDFRNNCLACLYHHADLRGNYSNLCPSLCKSPDYCLTKV